MTKRVTLTAAANGYMVEQEEGFGQSQTFVYPDLETALRSAREYFMPPEKAETIVERVVALLEKR